VSGGLQLLENLALVGGGGVMTVLTQTFADKRRERQIRREAHDKAVAEELERQRKELRQTQENVAELRGFVEGKAANRTVYVSKEDH
jgi:hypothetical protein